MPLEQYRRRRDFSRTPEPPGEAPEEAARQEGAGRARHRSPPSQAGSAPPVLRFVVGRHRATRLHYDLRLEVDGVLPSWSVPKGPTLDPGVRRMAVRVEDHPIDYLDFEGVIPAGEYGAGDAIVWDRGSWEPETTGDPSAALAAGELKFRLDGEKLRGRFTIVHTGGEQWLLIKKRDSDAVPGWDPEAHPRSVLSGRTNDEVAAAPDSSTAAESPRAASVSPGARTSGRAGPVSPDAVAPSGRRPRGPSPIVSEIAGAVVAPMPGFVEPMAAALADAPFSDPDWLFEVKWDGYRVQARVRAGAVRARTRTGRDAAAYLAGALEPPEWIDADEAIVDGELVALRPDGTPDFGLLQERIGHAGRWLERSDRQVELSGPSVLAYEVFDLLYLDGRLLLDVPLEGRKELLRRAVREHPVVRFAGHVQGDGESFFRAAVERGLEGAVAKHRRSRYLPGRRSSAWLKLKARPEQEFVVAGYARGTASHADLGSLLLAVDEGNGLRYAGRVGSGIDALTRSRLRAELDRRATSGPAVAEVPSAELHDPAVRWVEPGPVVRVRFAGWTRDGVIRQSSFSGVDADRASGGVVRERPIRSSPSHAPVVPAAELAEEHAAGEGDTAERQHAGSQDRAAGGHRAERRHAAHQTPKERQVSDEHHSTERRRAADERQPPERHMAGAEHAAPKSRSSERHPAETADGARVHQAAGTRGVAPASAGPGATEDELAALDAIGNAGAWRVGGQVVHLTNLDKVLFPDDGITKRDLIRYLAVIAPVLLPHLRQRPLNLTRFPNGIAVQSFWQRELHSQAPRWLRRWREPEPVDRRAHTYLIADGTAALAWLGNMAAIELHPWTSTTDAPTTPSFALIDIDPGERTTFDDVVILAKLYRAALDHLGVRGYPKLTGRRGIQVFVPVVPSYTFDETRDWVERLSRAVAATVPELVSWEWSVGQRRGLARLDYTQNARNKTLVAPYSVRPLPGAPVSAPIAWEELDDRGLSPGRWTMATIPARVRERGDLFAGVLTDRQELPTI